MRPTRASAALLGWVLVALASACGRRAPEPQSSGKEVAAPAPAATPAIADTVELSSAAVAEAGIATWKVEPVDLEHLLVLNGVVKYDENKVVAVSSNVAAKIASVPVDLGASVRKGQPLAWL